VAQTSTVNIGNAELLVHVEGDGPPLLLVHGFPLDHTMWERQIGAFRESHRVIAPDLRGFGGSSVTEGVVTMADFADDLATLLDRIGVTEPVCFCGLSMGGYIGWDFVRRHRERMNALIVCDSRAGGDSNETRQTRRLTAERVLAEGSGFLAESLSNKLFAPVTRSENPQLIAGLRDVITRTSPAAIAAASLGMAQREDATSLLPQIDVPTLLVVGEHDVISTANEMREMAEAIPGSQLAVIDRAGHMAPLEQPEAVNSAMRAFFATLGGRFQD